MTRPIRWAVPGEAVIYAGGVNERNAVEDLYPYQRLLDAWNRMSAEGFASSFLPAVRLRIGSNGRTIQAT